MLKKKSATRGIKVPENKLTEHNPIEPLPLPQKVIIPMQQHIGAPCELIVKRGTKVKTGEIIGKAGGFVSAALHATISGEVSGTTKIINHATGHLTDAVIITSDGEDNWVQTEPAGDPENISSQDILNLVSKAGIVGMGGASFPTQVKLMPPEGKNIDTLILNGCECEPYITADHRLMLEQGGKILLGLKLVQKVLNPDSIFIAIEDNKSDAITHLANLICEMGMQDNFKIVPLKSKYPMGGEKTLLTTITGREVPIGGLPLDVGIVVHNVSTVKAIYDAVYEDKPLIERVVTVSGLVNEPKNLLVRFGTPISALIDYCGGMKENANKLILGGPMMGIAHFDLNFPILKGSNSILIEHAAPIIESNCIRCGRCVYACPMHLLPYMYVKYAKTHNYNACQDAYIADCIECGSCSFSCPANIPIVEYIKTAKSELNKKRTRK
ncbi:MAG: electron transport complex subunit RsxC [Dehalococcoidia bacterium]|nr:electron transport complex subunit RsxC [Dehalococcoidia bacterium]